LKVPNETINTSSITKFYGTLSGAIMHMMTDRRTPATIPVGDRQFVRFLEATERLGENLKNIFDASFVKLVDEARMKPHAEAMGNVIGIEQAMKRKHFVSEEMTLPAPISGNLLITNRASPFRGSNDGPDDQCVGQEATKLNRASNS
jgi:hypothetical protein